MQNQLTGNEIAAIVLIVFILVIGMATVSFLLRDAVLAFREHDEVIKIMRQSAAPISFAQAEDIWRKTHN